MTDVERVGAIRRRALVAVHGAEAALFAYELFIETFDAFDPEQDRPDTLARARDTLRQRLERIET